MIGGFSCYFALNYLSRMRPFRNVDDTLGVIYTHGFAGLVGGLLLGFFADPNIVVYAATGGGATDLPGIAGIFNGGNAELFKDELVTALWVIGFSGIGTFILLKLVGLFVPLRMEEADMEEGDIAVHGHEVYPSDVPSLAFPPGRRAQSSLASPRAFGAVRFVRRPRRKVGAAVYLSAVTAGFVLEDVEHRRRGGQGDAGAPRRSNDVTHRSAGWSSVTAMS